MHTHKTRQEDVTNELREVAAAAACAGRRGEVAAQCSRVARGDERVARNRRRGPLTKSGIGLSLAKMATDKAQDSKGSDEYHLPEH